MADNFVKELLSTGIGTEGSLLIPKKIHDMLVEETPKALIPRSEAGWFFGPGDIPGSSIDLNLVDVNTMDVREVGEGAEVPIDQEEYSSINLKPLKYGVTIKITRELMEDSKFALLAHNVRTAARRLAENENSLVVTALDAAANTVAGGAAITIANITRGMQYLDDNDFTPTTFAVGMEVLNDLRNIDTFVEANKIGNTDMLQRGFLGTIYGMNVLKVSTNAGMTSTSSYIFDRDFAYAIAEKRPMTVENFALPQFDMSASTVTQRLKIREVRTAAIAKITTS